MAWIYCFIVHGGSVLTNFLWNAYQYPLHFTPVIFSLVHFWCYALCKLMQCLYERTIIANVRLLFTKTEPIARSICTHRVQSWRSFVATVYCSSLAGVQALIFWNLQLPNYGRRRMWMKYNRQGWICVMSVLDLDGSRRSSCMSAGSFSTGRLYERSSCALWPSVYLRRYRDREIRL